MDDKKDLTKAPELEGLSTLRLMVDGSEYVLTLGTGERSYGREGGELAFAYDADDFDAVSDRVKSYAELCDKLEPVWDAAELRRIAVVAAAKHEARVTIAGACDPVLSDEQYALVRETVGALR